MVKSFLLYRFMKQQFQTISSNSKEMSTSTRKIVSLVTRDYVFWWISNSLNANEDELWLALNFFNLNFEFAATAKFWAAVLQKYM